MCLNGGVCVSGWWCVCLDGGVCVWMVVCVSGWWCVCLDGGVCVWMVVSVLEIMVSILTLSDHFGILSDPKKLGQTFG